MCVCVFVCVVYIELCRIFNAVDGNVLFYVSLRFWLSLFLSLWLSVAPCNNDKHERRCLCTSVRIQQKNTIYKRTMYIARPFFFILLFLLLIIILHVYCDANTTVTHGYCDANTSNCAMLHHGVASGRWVKAKWFQTKINMFTLPCKFTWKFHCTKHTEFEKHCLGPNGFLCSFNRKSTQNIKCSYEDKTKKIWTINLMLQVNELKQKWMCWLYRWAHLRHKALRWFIYPSNIRTDAN